MTEFESNKSAYQNSWRGTHLIIPIRVSQGKSFIESGLIYVPFNQTADELSDKSDLIVERCNSSYINKYSQAPNVQHFSFTTALGLKITDLQIYLFENGIGFVTLFTFCHNSRINSIYHLVNNGYIGDYDGSDTYERLYNNISAVLEPCNLEIFFKNKSLLLNESYVLNIAFIADRFKELGTIEQLTLNTHKQIDLSSSFYDDSEKDIRYTYGARDVEKRTYRWGCCISTLDISYVYQNPILSDKHIGNDEIHDEMLRASASDLLLTILVLFQKFTCMQLNRDIHNEIYQKYSTQGIKKKNIRNLKRRVQEFRAFGTLAPCQVSRWNNICETYRGLFDVLGVNEALSEIEQKIDLLNDAQERIETDTKNLITTIITIFGLISIIDSVLSIVQIVTAGPRILVLCLIISIAVLSISAVSCSIIYFRKRR